MPLANKSLDDVLYGTAVWDRLDAQAVGAAIPVFTDLFYGGQEYAKRAVKAKRKGRKEALPFRIFRGRKALGDDEEFDERASMLIATEATRWWRDLSARVRPKLFGIIAEARENGRSVDWVVREIERTGLFGPRRALSIGVTETTRLFGAGAQAWMRHVEVPMWEWRTAEDARVDPECDSLAAGGPYPMSQDFIPAHTNCRCWMVPTYPDNTKAEVA